MMIDGKMERWKDGSMDWVGLGWIGLDWVGLAWNGMDGWIDGWICISRHAPYLYYNLISDHHETSSIS